MSTDPYDPITGEPLLHLGPKNDVHYDEDREEWVSHHAAEPDPMSAELDDEIPRRRQGFSSLTQSPNP